MPASAAQPSHIGRLGEMRCHPGRSAFLDDKSPTGAALHRQLHVFTGELTQPAGEQSPIGRADPTPQDLT